jgi:hypothetical protein
MGWVESRAKRLRREKTSRLVRIVEAGPSHPDWEMAVEILVERRERTYDRAWEDAAADALPRADEYPFSVEIEGLVPASTSTKKGQPSLYLEPECKHRGHYIAERLLASSYRGGLVWADGTVAVLLTPELFGRVGPWSMPATPAFGDLRDVVYWPWPDMKAPPMNGQTFERIAAILAMRDAGKTIEVACFGGHGRTGTLVAILAALIEGWDADDAVHLLRKRYCRRAVETAEQEQFVVEMIETLRNRR